MHYIRLLRSPEVNASNANAVVLSLKLTITTDLGDSFLQPQDPVQLVFASRHAPRGANLPARGTRLQTTKGESAVLWTRGMRVLKIDLVLPRKLLRHHVDVEISAQDPRGRSQFSFSATSDVLPWRSGQDAARSQGLVAGIHAELDDGVGSDVAYREIAFQCSPTDKDSTKLLVEEEIGESIARHIWDAGFVTAALLADACLADDRGLNIRDLMPVTKNEVNVLELGCGVGVLGIAIATCLHEAARVQDMVDFSSTVLLTDLPEAEERAKANIKRYTDRQSKTDQSERTGLDYENLDWEDGSQGKFGDLVKSRLWDYIALSDCTYNVDSFPVLVGTLSALHRHNVSHLRADDDANAKTKVILSTKPRHDSETALFELLRAEGWTSRLMKSVPLSNIGADDEHVDVYSLEKNEQECDNGLKKRKRANEVDTPSKKNTDTGDT